MGGHITVHSKLGQGSEFAFDIKVKATSRMQVSLDRLITPPKQQETSDITLLKTLLVEDNPINVEYALRYHAITLLFS
jgi:hypothetical protein